MSIQRFVNDNEFSSSQCDVVGTPANLSQLKNEISTTDLILRKTELIGQDASRLRFKFM